MMQSTPSEDYEYTFEYKLEDDYNYKPDFRGTLNHSINIQQPLYRSYESYPSYITITLHDKKETWFQYIKSKVTRFFECFSIKIY